MVRSRYRGATMMATAVLPTCASQSSACLAVHSPSSAASRQFHLVLERVPQLEIKLANNATVRDEIIAPLLRDDKRVYVILDRAVDGSGYPVRNKSRTPGGQIIYIGVASSRIELDVAKDRDITMVADDAVHWWLDNLTASDLYTLITSSAYSADRIGPIAGYEAHPQAGYTYFTIGSDNVVGMRWFDNYFALPLTSYLSAYYDTAWTRVLARHGRATTIAWRSAAAYSATQAIPHAIADAAGATEQLHLHLHALSVKRPCQALLGCALWRLSGAFSA